MKCKLIFGICVTLVFVIPDVDFLYWLEIFISNQWFNFYKVVSSWIFSENSKETYKAMLWNLGAFYFVFV